jgi:hypothetical protein
MLSMLLMSSAQAQHALNNLQHIHAQHALKDLSENIIKVHKKNADLLTYIPLQILQRNLGDYCRLQKVAKLLNMI